jgi:hypothetical protein
LRFFLPLLLIGVVDEALVPPLDLNAATVPLSLASVSPSIAVGESAATTAADQDGFS